MKRYLPTIIVAIACSAVSALVTALAVAHHHQNILFMFTGGRPADYLITAAKIREGKSDELVKSLEWNAQVEFLQQRYQKNKQWTFDYSYQVLDAYMKKYDIPVADPLRKLPSPEKSFSEEQFMQILSLPAPDKWPEWPAALYKE